MNNKCNRDIIFQSGDCAIFKSLSSPKGSDFIIESSLVSQARAWETVKTEIILFQLASSLVSQTQGFGNIKVISSAFYPLTIAYSLLPIHHCLFTIAYSPLPIHHSPFTA